MSASSSFLSEFLKTFSNEKHRVWSRLQGNAVWKQFVHFVDSVFPFYWTTVLVQRTALHWPLMQYWTFFHALITLLNMFQCGPTSCLTTSDPSSSLLKRSTSTTESQFCFKSSGLWVQSLLQIIVEQNGRISPQRLLYWEMKLRWTDGVSKVSLSCLIHL